MLRVRALVENAAVPGSTFRAEHGMRWSIETPDGHILFDTGTSGEVMLDQALKAAFGDRVQPSPAGTVRTF